MGLPGGIEPAMSHLGGHLLLPLFRASEQVFKVSHVPVTDIGKSVGSESGVANSSAGTCMRAGIEPFSVRKLHDERWESPVPYAVSTKFRILGEQPIRSV
jgi:hypothetical protein